MTKSPFDLTGKCAIITGAGKGLGRGMAVALAEAGANIVGVQRSSMKEVQDDVQRTGSHFLGLQLNVGDKAVYADILKEAEASFGTIDILINNAGIIRRSDTLDLEQQDWDDVIDINLTTPMLLSQAVARYWVEKNRGGKIINICSMLSFQGGIRVAGYTASKSGLLGLTRLLANEWASKSINVNAIAPGYFATDNTKALQADEKRNAEILSRIPAGRWGKPSDLGGAAVFLASHASDYVHGAVLPVDGGWLAR